MTTQKISDQKLTLDQVADHLDTLDASVIGHFYFAGSEIGMGRTLIDGDDQRGKEASEVICITLSMSIREGEHGKVRDALIEFNAFYAEGRDKPSHTERLFGTCDNDSLADVQSKLMACLSRYAHLHTCVDIEARSMTDLKTFFDIATHDFPAQPNRAPSGAILEQGWVSQPTVGLYAVLEPDGESFSRGIYTVTAGAEGQLIYGGMRLVSMAAPGTLWHRLADYPDL